MKKKTKRIMFELEVYPSFNIYSFFKLFKKIQYKGFFKEIISIWKLEEIGKKVRLTESETKKQQEDLFILTEEFGLK